VRRYHRAPDAAASLLARRSRHLWCAVSIIILARSDDSNHEKEPPLRLVVRRTLFYTYVALVLIATLAPLSGGIFDTAARYDKLAHVALLAGVAFLMLLSLDSGRRQEFIAAVVLTTALAGVIELLQGILPFRSAEPWDFAAGTVGAVLGAAAALPLVSKRE
jgi:VanZ family protein